MTRKPTSRPPGPPSLADVLASLPVMSDEPIDVSPIMNPAPPEPTEEPPVAFPHAETPYDQQIVKPEGPVAAPAADPATEVGTFIRPGEVTRYENRIHMVDAYRFDGRLHAAPDWIDRNWLASADGAAALNVSVFVDGKDYEIGVAKIGDYVCRQNNIVDDPKAPGGRREVQGQLVVVPRDEFNRLYAGYTERAPDEPVNG